MPDPSHPPGPPPLDGRIAANPEGVLVDPNDACTVYEINYLSNIAPQYDDRFNGGRGLWYQLETRIRQDIVGTGTPIHVISGTVFGNAPIQTVGARLIPIPHMDFQILITPYGVVRLLFVHSPQIGAHGCALRATLEDWIVAMADIGAVSGLGFFAGASDELEASLQHRTVARCGRYSRGSRVNVRPRNKAELQLNRERLGSSRRRDRAMGRIRGRRAVTSRNLATTGQSTRDVAGSHVAGTRAARPPYARALSTNLIDIWGQTGWALGTAAALC